MLKSGSWQHRGQARQQQKPKEPVTRMDVHYRHSAITNPQALTQARRTCPKGKEAALTHCPLPHEIFDSLLTITNPNFIETHLSRTSTVKYVNCRGKVAGSPDAFSTCAQQQAPAQITLRNRTVVGLADLLVPGGRECPVPFLPYHETKKIGYRSMALRRTRS